MTTTIEPSRTVRIASLDLLKGIVIVVMALDHTRDYFHFSSWYFAATDVEKTTLPIFFARWVTHFCAPVFSFLAGVSAFLVGRQMSAKQLSQFLVTRGLWLVFVQLTFVNFAWTFDPYFRYNELAVIWSLGISMILLAAIIHLPLKIIIAFSIVLIFGHNLLDNIHHKSFLWYLLHEEHLYVYPNGYILLIVYPLIPWIGIMSLGYALGKIFYAKDVNPSWRKKLLIYIGLGSLTMFILLRWVNFYGDPLPWQNYGSALKTLMSFVNTNKYPPSLLFILMSLGPAFIFLARSENANGPVVRFFSVFGRVPFFFYIVHLYVIHAAAIIAAALTGYGSSMIVLTDWVSQVESLRGYGFSIAVVVAIWIIIIVLLYPLCRAFDRYKMANKDKRWLSYL